MSMPTSNNLFSFHTFFDKEDMPKLCFKLKYTGSFDYFGPIDRAKMVKQVLDFCQAEGRVQGDLEPVLQAYIDHVVDEHVKPESFPLDSAWMSLRITAPSNLFDYGHWHRDPGFVSFNHGEHHYYHHDSPRPKAFKVGATIQGTSSIFLVGRGHNLPTTIYNDDKSVRNHSPNPSHDRVNVADFQSEQQRQEFLSTMSAGEKQAYSCMSFTEKARYREMSADAKREYLEMSSLERNEYLKMDSHERNEHLSKSAQNRQRDILFQQRQYHGDVSEHMRDVRVENAKPGQAVKWSVDDRESNFGCGHAEAPLGLHRLNITMMPGNEAEVRGLAKRWGFEDSWGIGEETNSSEEFVFETACLRAIKL